MKPTSPLFTTLLMAFLAALGWLPNGFAQTPTFVTITAQPDTTNNYAVQTNQIISIVGVSSAGGTSVGNALTGNLADGTSIYLAPANPGSLQMVTGLTNIVLLGANLPTWVTLKITMPPSTNAVSNYVPADAVVIPTTATGSVQIILESSTDLLNWSAAMPGTYSAASATNRFFRVRAVHN